MQQRSKTQDLMLERWYHFFLDVCKTARRLNYGIAVHPSHTQEFMDMMERVAEDDMWPYAKSELPPLVAHIDVPDTQYMLIDTKTMKVLSTQAALQSRKGLGRFNTLYTPTEGIKRS